jgi:hypothetical protein
MDSTRAWQAVPCWRCPGRTLRQLWRGASLQHTKHHAQQAKAAPGKHWRLECLQAALRTLCLDLATDAAAHGQPPLQYAAKPGAEPALQRLLSVARLCTDRRLFGAGALRMCACARMDSLCGGPLAGMFGGRITNLLLLAPVCRPAAVGLVHRCCCCCCPCAVLCCDVLCCAVMCCPCAGLHATADLMNLLIELQDVCVMEHCVDIITWLERQRAWLSSPEFDGNSSAQLISSPANTVRGQRAAGRKQHTAVRSAERAHVLLSVHGGAQSPAAAPDDADLDLEALSACQHVCAALLSAAPAPAACRACFTQSPTCP